MNCLFSLDSPVGGGNTLVGGKPPFNYNRRRNPSSREISLKNNAGRSEV